MLTKKLGALLMLVAACKGGDQDASRGGAKDTTKGGCVVTASKPAELVTGKTPGLIAPFTGLALGMARADAAKACPNLFERDGGKQTGNFSVNEIVGKFGKDYVQGRLEFINDKLDAVNLSAPPEIAEALAAAWGPPKVSSGDKPANAWFDEATHVRAILGPVEYDGRRNLTVSSFVPLAAFVEPDTARIAWKPQDVLGKQPAELAKQFARYLVATKTSEATKAKTAEMMKDLDKEVAAMGIDTKRNANLPELELPASPYAADRSTHVILYTHDDGSVRSYGLWFRTAELSPAYGWPGQSAELTKLMDEMWGPHKMVKETLGDRMTWFDAKRGLRASTQLDKPEELDLVYTRYLPLANLFGAPGATWGFEKAERPLLGATPDEIVAAYGTAGVIKRDDTSGTITLSLPPTDYDGDTAVTSILMFVRNGKVGDYRFDIPFEGYEPAKAEYQAALEAKLGKGKPARDEIKYGKHVTARFSDITHELEIIVEK